ncbi:ABC transporter ATP-binding protein [Lentzea flaviverrucosa]|uniref:ABC-2 type transport system ATP-binding protein n=1 Tax=Lentzea flaviverrucosa TaxID=200379 RepID=A0A1H9D4L5_9PSEU|nr:ABC transporter ATP-binding protein [Lentzea flaviverrucosa]RDI24746.1 ABC-2 type transport system ATP-binding protein [Lentzea flaviverrucosa]SEQ08405.1 ABC-2 type transport system ATP-binding protein [Lentzea flaviverrucosa]
MQAIQADNLVVRVGGRKGRDAVNGLSLGLGRGVHGLLGPNGAGKTTLIRTLATVQSPTSGTLSLLGTPAGGKLRPVRRRLGYLPQHFGYYKRFKVREFVEYLAWLKEMPPALIPKAVREALERVGLSDRAEDRMKSLSGGMVRRVGIAQAIVNEPELLLLDEPTVGLDPAQRLRFRELVAELGREACVLISTHLVEDVAAACTDVVLVNEGSLVFQGSPADLATAGTASHVGDSPIERGYTALISAKSTGGAW